MSVHFRFDWVDAGPSPDVLAQHTMAALSVAARGAVVTGALDRQSGTYTRTVVVPLFSVAEWLVANWWHIWHEVGDVDKQPHPAFEARHNLAFAGDGFVLPSLRMTRATGRMRLEWARYSPEYARIEFVDEGQHDVEPAELETQFRNLIDAVLERLHGRPETRHGLLSSLETARQAQSRAFAAEFLAPAAALRRKINGGRADVEQIDDLGNEFGVSDWVIRHQIENHDLAKVAAY